MLRIVILLSALATFVAPAFGQSLAELREHIVGEEGYSTTVYWSRGQPHIGIGHLIHGPVSQRISRSQVERLFRQDLTVACEAAFSGVQHFAQHPKAVRIIMVALAYNTGVSGYYQFIRFRAAIDRYDYRGAADELSNSMWCRQLPDRAARYIALLNSQATR